MPRAQIIPDLPAGLRRISLRVPVARVPEVPLDAYGKKHVEVQLSREQDAGLKALRTGLDETGARLTPDGRRVASAADCIRWLLNSVTSTSPALAAPRPRPAVKGESA